MKKNNQLQTAVYPQKTHFIGHKSNSNFQPRIEHIVARFESNNLSKDG